MQKGLCAAGDVPVRGKQMARYRRISLLCAYVLFLRQDLKTLPENKTAGVYLREKGRKEVISCTGSLSQAAGCFQPVSVAQLEGSCCGHTLGATAAFLSKGGRSREHGMLHAAGLVSRCLVTQSSIQVSPGTLFAYTFSGSSLGDEHCSWRLAF